MGALKDVTAFPTQPRLLSFPAVHQRLRLCVWESYSKYKVTTAALGTSPEPLSQGHFPSALTVTGTSDCACRYSSLLSD